MKSDLLFLGVCQGAVSRREGIQWDYFGVSKALVCPFFPQPLQGTMLLLAFPNSAFQAEASYRFSLRALEDPEHSASIDFSWTHLSKSQGEGAIKNTGPRLTREGFEAKVLEPHQAVDHQTSEREAAYSLFPVPSPPLLVRKPCTVEVCLEDEQHNRPIGSFYCAFAKPAPMSESERLALKSRPTAVRAIHVEVGCKKCGSRLSLETRLDPSDPRELASPQSILLATAPDTWSCACGHDYPLTYMKDGLHELFRRGPLADAGPMKFARLYERGAVSAILAEYTDLINSEPQEEEVQKFLETNSIMWHFLAPRRILPKPAILTRYRADFAILTERRTLFLVEIEKPHTKLTKKDGGVSAQLQAGLNQIRDWRVIIQDNRNAVLSELGFDQGDVDDIRYILVAGLAWRTHRDGMMKLRRDRPHDISIYTFDELASFLDSTRCQMERL